MKQLVEFIPLVIFFIVYKMVDIYAATAALMVAMTITFIYSYFKNGKKAEKMQIITLAMILIFGTLTLVLHDDVFIKWKVTLVYAVFSIALLVTQFIFKKPAIKQMLGKELELPDNIWNNLNLAWALFFASLGAINVYVAFTMSQEVWVNFKVFGLLAVTLLFTILSGLYLYKHLPQDSQKNSVNDKK
ncbi:putative intracellular septation protein A [Psychromonas marina]|uniref:Inner membrane-spanning protein YciB n=1 Tax=Psychromonas marina TaxID=88364 RepID=A0ABQ6DVM8_9GAMM|nr:septation protein A [Psychromonas marina]GLS89151.1 putative intracellular septation protein A [Psychromonas marina]